MESNREVFQDQREQEVINNPLDFQQPEEQPKDIFDWCNEKQEKRELPYHLDLEARANDYNAAIKRNQLAKYGDRDADFIELFYNPPKAKLDKQLVYHNHARPMTDVERIHHIPSVSQADKDLRIKKMKDGFKNLKSKPRTVD